MQKQEDPLRIVEMGLRLDIVDLTAELDMGTGFRGLIAYRDLLSVPEERERYRRLRRRIEALNREFNRQVRQEVKRQTEEFQMKYAQREVEAV